jgi:hypothetical protein
MTEFSKFSNVDRRKFLLGLAGSIGVAASPQLAAAAIAGAAAFGQGVATSGDDRLVRWRSGVKISQVSPVPGRHSMHTYFNLSPESPDGQLVLFFVGTAADGQFGDIVIRNRKSGEERTLASNIATEDAHRVACQQWVSGGKNVVYHEFEGSVPVVKVVDVASGKIRELARGWLCSWGQPQSDLVPIYPPHWKNSGGETDLKMMNVRTGESHVIITMPATLAEYGPQIQKTFKGRPITLFFPEMSPNMERVTYKLSTPLSEDFRSDGASFREMLVTYDMKNSKFLFIRDKWGHPDWHPDSRMQLNVPTCIDDTDTGAETDVPGLPVFPGQHPSFSFVGKIFATDTHLETFGGAKGWWGVAVADVRGHDYVMLHTFDNSHGATSWRISHPHPAFSPDSKRIYFNVSSTQWTRLFVAESTLGGEVT